MPRENLLYHGEYGIGIKQIHIQQCIKQFTYNHWLAALVKGKCSSTKPTCLATGVECHPDTEQIQYRPYKIPWPCWKLNQGLTAPQARTLQVCHTTPLHSTNNVNIKAKCGRGVEGE